MGGGNRNSQSKAERRVDRKQRREAEARQNHRDKIKAREKEIKEENKDKPKVVKAWKRTDQDGSVILWNFIKISKTSKYILAGMAAIVILFAISPVFEMPDYIPPERYTFAECEAIGFEDVYCMYDFKWTREYADGGVIVQYAEFDPFVDLDRDENKYTAEEQDFLPPTREDLTDEEWKIELDKIIQGNFILPMAYGQMDEFGLEFLEDDLPDGKDALNDYIDQLRLDLDILEIKMKELENDLQNWNIDEAELKNDKFTTENDFEQAEEDLDEAKTAYRHAQDMVVRNSEDRRLQDLAFTEYRAQILVFNNMEKTYDRMMVLYNLGYTTHWAQETEMDTLNDELDIMLKDLAKARIKLNLVFRDFQFISVNLSRTCMTLIQYELQTKCPTYREMVPLFDNTLRNISGEFVDIGYDIKRLPAPLKDHWRYYEQVPEWRVVTVDADPSLFKRGVEIIIQAKDFTVIERSGARDKSDSYNSETLETTTWKNIHVSKKCDSVSVGPDLNAIEAAILHVLNKCTTDLSEFKEVTVKEPTIIPKEQSAHYQYFQWLKDVIAGLRDTTVEYVTPTK